MPAFSLFEFLIGQLTGFVLGLAGSFLTWWFLTHRIVPAIAFGSFVSKLPYGDQDGSKAYRIKFENIGKRDVLDGYVMVFLSIKGLRHKSTWTSFRIPLDFSGETSLYIPLLAAGSNRVYRLCLEVSQELKDSKYLPAEIREKARRGQLTLEHLLQFEESRLRVFVGGTDAISGARRVFRSQFYHLADVREHRFRGLGQGAAADEEQ